MRPALLPFFVVFICPSQQFSVFPSCPLGSSGCRAKLYTAPTVLPARDILARPIRATRLAVSSLSMSDGDSASPFSPLIPLAWRGPVLISVQSLWVRGAQPAPRARGRHLPTIGCCLCTYFPIRSLTRALTFCWDETSMQKPRSSNQPTRKTFAWWWTTMTTTRSMKSSGFCVKLLAAPGRW